MYQDNRRFGSDKVRKGTFLEVGVSFSGELKFRCVTGGSGDANSLPNWEGRTAHSLVCLVVWKSLNGEDREMRNQR